jgi:RimJ/RimL family protein N-acetyltransferase
MLGMPQPPSYHGGMVELLSVTPALLDQALTGHIPVAAGWSVWPDRLGQVRFGDWGTKLVVWRAPRTLVGICGFHGAPAAGVVEIGYAIAEAWRGRGLATAAARLLIAQAFADARVDAVVAHTRAEPGPSTRLLERLGFAPVRALVDLEDGPVWLWRLGRDVARHGVAGA